MTTLNPYIYFNGNCEDAFNFYKVVFKKEITYFRAIPAAKHVGEALGMLGSDDWELTTSFTRNFSNGFEIYYYFKKKIN